MMSYESPYQALKESGIRDLVNEFYRIMDASPNYSELRAMHSADLSGISEKLGDYLVGWMGGPQIYLEKYGSVCMTGPHKAFSIGPKERDAWVSCMYEAMDSLALSDDVKEMLKNPIYRLANAVKNR
ncbi:group II truncated hemoglobin [Halioxenophilus aromaticivorans]|jgi:hemoglobin|uniref:Globin n=1 Tax=Halioxenophilus aromaticivorans TaxID=1306992 RepID=A0AAV3U451_9ALTE|tara:strand:+ start:89 stop:469 length:381 start_codon:yes stop_codon:yes gene_type:complete